MRHLDDQRLIEAARGEGGEAARRHLERCTECREAVARWRRWLDGLAAMERETLREPERHRLAVLFRTLGPARRETLVARLLRPIAEALPAVRGAAAARLAEYEAGPYRLAVEIRPAGPKRYDLHLMVLSPDGEPVEGSRVVLVSDDLPGVIVRLDRHGEAHVPALPPGRYAVRCWLPGGPVELPEVAVGGGDGS